MPRLDEARLRYYEETLPNSFHDSLGHRGYRIALELIDEVRASWDERDEFREGNDHWIEMHDAEARRRNVLQSQLDVALAALDWILACWGRTDDDCIRGDMQEAIDAGHAAVVLCREKPTDGTG